MDATGSLPPRPGTTDLGRGGGPDPIHDRPFPSIAASSAAPPSATDGPDDWAAQAAEAVERLVGSVRAKTVDPLEKVARALVYGLVAAIVGLAAAVLGAVALVRLLDIALPGGVWSAHALTGGIFTLGGLFLWRKRTVKTVKV